MGSTLCHWSIAASGRGKASMHAHTHSNFPAKIKFKKPSMWLVCAWFKTRKQGRNYLPALEILIVTANYSTDTSKRYNI